MNAKDLRRSNSQVMLEAKQQLAQYIQGQISTEELCNLWGLHYPQEGNAIDEWLEGGIRVWCKGIQKPSYDGR